MSATSSVRSFAGIYSNVPFHTPGQPETDHHHHDLKCDSENGSGLGGFLLAASLVRLRG
ncbi:hypothetical protein B0H19DRAFT_1143716 [Mycena capillaripes]|nr:hypothetical protein B0H19DRAFT_1143716 [Mycena capillaripes]